jgi:hypothetical protein
MSIGSIGSTPSLWQQDQNYWNDQQSWDSTSAASTSLITAMATAETNQGKGLAAIANQTALDRVNSQLSAAIQSVLSGGATSSSSSGTTGSSSSSSSSSSTAAVPATATGKNPVTIGTSLSILGIPAGGTITVSAGGNTTTYASTGSDTVGDLMNAINTDSVGNAAVTASLSKDGDLVLTSKNDTDTIIVGGTYASNLGFGVANNTFKPTAASSNASTATSSSGASSAASSTSTSTASSTSTTAVQTLASVNASSAASLLSDSGVSGSLVDMLA